MTAQDGSAALAHGGGPVLDAAGWATWVVGPEYPSRVARASLRAASPVLLVLPLVASQQVAAAVHP
ncbi:hypothetical protein [Cellulomonas soli]|uniref:Uncharacterized protein n=1 Tax=Cellulomonas soli TaxID=931535 RepID=A0A512PD85_9CELL|nr:hypothetical protein [Cellulomonas soli]NYI60170.1 hypothetical protein [Cellulomonas soli]GEP69177.1 hypothetical protein CSO01_18920 [Cellulomonas soli]